MSDNKFFIGLGATVPSTRVLKPPGGDCSDLFGLKTRQYAQIKGLKGTSTVIDYLLSQGLPLVTSMDMPQRTSTLSSRNSTATPLNVFNNPKDSTVVPSSLTKDHDSNVTKEPFYFDIGSVGDSFDGLNIKDENKQNCETLKTSPPNYGLSSLEAKSPKKTGEIKSAVKTLDSSFIRKSRLSNNCRNSNDRSTAGSKLNADTEVEKKFVRNPITGALTEVKSWNKSNSEASKIRSAQEIRSKFGIRTSPRHNSDDSSKASSEVTTRRNPITGEGISASPHLLDVTHSRIRVIQPPGGISSGIF